MSILRAVPNEPPRPVTTRELQDAWAVHRALVLAESGDETLSENPRFKVLRMDAYATFHDLMTRYCHGR